MTEQLLTAIQVAEILNISKAGAYNLMQRGQLPSLKIGRSVRVILRDLEQFIQENKQVIG
jgi:putative molybdopterin biosynthesis protein